MNHGMFKGWKEVFGFTFSQNVKTKAFKAAIIGISILLFIVFFGINLGVGYYKETKHKKNHEDTNDIEKLYFVNQTDIKELNTDNFRLYGEFEKDIAIEVLSDEKEVKTLLDKAQEDDRREMAIVVSKYQEEDNCYELLVSQTSTCQDSQVRRIAEDFEKYFDERKLEFAGIDSKDMELIMSDSSVSSVDIDEADKGLAQILMEIFLPMIVILAMYMMILLYGQSISKIIVVEKNSKLMEMLLISVKPYAIIVGKVLAMYLVAVIEMVTWVVSGVAGYIISDKLAQSLFDNYENPVLDVIKIMQDNISGAFSTQAVIMCVISVLVGFFAYCVLSALITSNITKAEDLANGSAVYQIIVVIGYLLSYLLPLVQKNGILIKILRYVPITSAFMLPSDVLIGNISLLGSVVSVLILAVSIVVMVILTGKIYKKKVF